MGSRAGRTTTVRPHRTTEREFWKGMARAFAGAVIFALPLLMTMEMWRLGFYVDRARLALFLIVMLPVLFGLAHFSGFRRTTSWVSEAVDTVTALGVGFAAATAMLLLMNVIVPTMPLGEVVGKISLEAVPSAFGAVLAQRELGGGNGERRPEQWGTEGKRYAGELFFMLAGAIFFVFTIAPTEEVVLIALRMSYWHQLVMVVVSIALLHAFVYAVEFRGQEVVPPGTPLWLVFLRFTLVGYAIALLVCAYALWTFGQYEAGAYGTLLSGVVVLGFPATLGVAVARLVL